MMLYERSLGIETRLQTVLRLIETGQYSTPSLAEEVGVSIPTISRDVTALRQRGHDIVAERRDGAWYYRLAASKQNNFKKEPAVKRSKGKPR